MKKFLIFLLLIFVIFVVFEKRAIIWAKKESPAASSTIASALTSGLPVVVKVGADWCPPCRQMKPVIEELAKEEKGKIIFLDLKIDDNRDLAKQYKINLIPTVLFYDRQGKFKGKEVGYMSKEELLKKVQELKL